MTCKDDAIKAVDNRWRGAREIQARVGQWSNTGIRHALVALSSQNRIETRAVPIRGGNVRYEYRLPQGAK